IEHARVERAIVQLAKRDERRQRDATIAAAERAVLQQREQKRGDFLRERWIRFSPERRHLRTLHRIDQTELRFDDAGLRLIAAELGADRAMQLDEILDAEVTNAVSR